VFGKHRFVQQNLWKWTLGRLEYLQSLCVSGSRNIDISSFLTTKQFEEALITDKKKLSLVEPLTVEDRKFLQSIFSPVFDQSTVDLSKFDTEKIQGYAIVLKQIDGKIFPLILSQYRMIFLMSSQGFSLVNDLILSKG